MDFYLVIDGYNILNSWTELAEIMKDSMEDARDRLIHILNNYAGYKKYRVIVVFDGHKVRNNPGEKIVYHNVEVIYSPEGITADQVIEKEVGKLLRTHKVFVATSDKLQQEIIWSKGAYRISARELIEEIRNTQKEYREKINVRNTGKKNYLESNLNSDILEALEKIRRKKH